MVGCVYIRGAVEGGSGGLFPYVKIKRVFFGGGGGGGGGAQPLPLNIH